uniref:Uncharacterized protein LOC102804318 n=1 Tax=Saccoglossus kowalevskii TaxID=10224 RepID=A0ABM0MY57_SACKO|nr:PREDICTED: uncharacterized protein LOC102804318 [Saccoglossus kowalevskii]
MAKFELSRMIGNITKAVADLQKKNNLSCLYVACPEWSTSILDELSKFIPKEQIYHLKRLPVNADNRKLLDDYYAASLIEQEICYRSRVFLAAGFSNWSNFVTKERDLEGKITFNIKELPGIPNYRTLNLL